MVAPKKAKLAEAESSLEKTIEILNSKRAELQEVEDRVESLKQQFAEMTEKKKQLEFQVFFRSLFIVLHLLFRNILSIKREEKPIKYISI